MQRDNVTRLLYAYSADSGTVAAGGTATDSIAIEADSDFVIVKQSMHVTDGAGAALTWDSRIIPNVTLQIIDTGSGRQFFDGEQPAANLFGTGEIPFILPAAQLVRANSVLRVNFTSFEASADRRLQLSFIGFKIYEY